MKLEKQDKEIKEQVIRLILQQTSKT